MWADVVCRQKQICFLSVRCNDNYLESQVSPSRTRRCRAQQAMLDRVAMRIAGPKSALPLLGLRPPARGPSTARVRSAEDTVTSGISRRPVSRRTAATRSSAIMAAPLHRTSRRAIASRALRPNPAPARNAAARELCSGRSPRAASTTAGMPSTCARNAWVQATTLSSTKKRSWWSRRASGDSDAAYVSTPVLASTCICRGSSHRIVPNIR